MFEFIKGRKANTFLALVNCADASTLSTASFPAKIGSSADCKIDIPSAEFIWEANPSSKGGVEITILTSGSAFVNGAEVSDSFKVDGVATLQVGNSLYYLITDSEILEKAKRMDVSKWLIFYAESGRIEDEVAFPRLKSAVLNRGLTGDGIAICPRGFEIGFMFTTVFDSRSTTSESLLPSLSESVDAITCPLCWLKFDVGDAMSIAVHESLRGDPVLGSEEMLRFLPTSFNEDGVALDPAEMPAPDVACPHCRRKLPPSYLDVERRIFSIVGAPSSGKSYYLSVLIKELQGSLYNNFGIALKDLDPSGNMLLTQMKNRLFSAKRPEDAILAKTALEGAMYERYPRYGKMVALPKPMTYSLTLNDHPETSIIFYDNAGEHFEPGLDIEESPGAMHVASSNAIFFLFDPVSNRNFKRLIGNHPDPQLNIGGRIDQQDTILSEMEVRIKRILAIEPSKRIDTPIAVIIGKCDIWRDKLDDELRNPIVDGMLDMKIIDSNSEILRRFLLSIDPSIPSGAHSISSNVRYFALSALGHSPEMLTLGECAGKIAPIPEKLNPIDVDIPTIWALSQTTNMIPVR